MGDERGKIEMDCALDSVGTCMLHHVNHATDDDTPCPFVMPPWLTGIKYATPSANTECFACSRALWEHER